MTSPHQARSAFESCPAATGEAHCTHFPDQAHRCAQARRHQQWWHTCTCGSEWVSVIDLDQDANMSYRPSTTPTGHGEIVIPIKPTTNHPPAAEKENPSHDQP